MENTSTHQQEESQNPGPSFVTILVGLLLLALLGVGFLYAAQKFEVWPYAQTTPTPSADTGTETYTSSDYGYQISYPASWHHEECRDAGPGGTYLLTSFGTAEDLVICNSDAPILGLVNITATPGALNEMEIAGTFGALDNATRQNVMIDGNAAVRVQGITRQLSAESQGIGPEAGSTYVAIWSAQGSNLYRFIFIGAANDLTQFDRVVSTFQFAK